MKHSLKDYSLNIPDEQYHDDPAWSYSIIARYAKDGFNAIATLHDKMVATPSMEFGSLFDSILTKGKKTLDEYVVSSTCPPPAEKGVLDILLRDHNCAFIELTDEDLVKALTEAEYKKATKFETQYKNIQQNSQYYEARRTGKKIVSQADWNDAVEMAKIFRESPYLSSLFGKVSDGKKEFLYQTQYLTDWTLPNGVEVKLKIMPDLLVVDHEAKTIRPVDLKTSSFPAYDFVDNFIRFRYDIQASLYTDVIGKIMSEDEYYQDFTLLPYFFTDISRTDKVPVTYEYDPKDESQVNGLAFSQYQYKNWQTLLMEILEYEKNNSRVPSYIIEEGPNDLLALLNNKK